MSRSPLSFLSKTRLKYYFNTAHYYQDLHCSLMYRCPTAVLITRDTAKSAFHYNLYTYLLLSLAGQFIASSPAFHFTARNFLPLAPLVHPWFRPICLPAVLAQFASPSFRPICPSSSFYCSNCSWCSSLAFTDPVQLPRV